MGVDVNQILARSRRSTPTRARRPVRTACPTSSPSAPGVFLTPYGLVNNYWDGNYWNNNFSNENDVYSAYATAKFETEVLSIPIRGALGVRYEYTDNKIVALNCTNCCQRSVGRAGPGQPRPDHQDDDAQLRLLAAVAGPRGRPARRPDPALRGLFDLCAPAAARHRADHLRPDPGRPDAAGRSGLHRDHRRDGPEALHLRLLDLSLEWYNRPGGLISVAAYRKKIDG